MYYRLSELLDAEILLATAYREKDSFVAEEAVKVMTTLQDSYGERNLDYGGNVLLFPNCTTYVKYHRDICRFYHVEPKDFEYEEQLGIGDHGLSWTERMYIWGTENALVLIYPSMPEIDGMD